MHEQNRQATEEASISTGNGLRKLCAVVAYKVNSIIFLPACSCLPCFLYHAINRNGPAVGGGALGGHFDGALLIDVRTLYPNGHSASGHSMVFIKFPDSLACSALKRCLWVVNTFTWVVNSK